MIRDAARALVIVLALLILLAEVQRADEVEEFNNPEGSQQWKS